MRDTHEGEWRMRRVLLLLLLKSVVTDCVQPHRRQPRIKDWRNYSGEEGGVKVPSKEETLGSGSKSKDVQKF